MKSPQILPFGSPTGVLIERVFFWIPTSHPALWAEVSVLEKQEEWACVCVVRVEGHKGAGGCLVSIKGIAQPGAWDH